MLVSIKEKALQIAAEQLDISPSKYKQAIERCEAIKHYLIGKIPCSLNPEIYLQGSFKLGTEIRPYKDSRDTDYDIDIVCCLLCEKTSVNPREIKYLVGDLLKAHGTYNRMLDREGKRCWTLNYTEQDGIGFHIDILPCIQNNIHLYSNAISVTNKNKNLGSYSWSSSNPKDFAYWFNTKNKYSFNLLQKYQKQIIFEKLNQENVFSRIDDIPDIHVKTPLQRTIQILKRHRDVCFCGHKYEKFKPISMIITVLVAQIYKNEKTILEVLKKFIENMVCCAEQLKWALSNKGEIKSSNLIQIKKDNTWYIPNPINDGENFADKWHETESGIAHARAIAFFQWIEWVREDFLGEIDQYDEQYYTRLLALPNKTISDAYFKFINVPHRQRPLWPLRLQHKVQINAQFKKFGLWKEFKSGEPLEKALTLMFCATTAVPPPFQVYWQVVNTGKEAEENHQLRGQIFQAKTAGRGGLRQKEATKYTGIHWIECFIIKNEICVARSGEFIVRII